MVLTVPEHRARKTTLVEYALNYLSAPHVSPFSSVKGKYVRLSTLHSGFGDELNEYWYKLLAAMHV